ncbi:MAG TPA: glycosyltransferase [Solirubrobacterales bacterium]|jgi:glycosyltransferase involved in cell wall biosynthesis|nr:glycosyltransferase [Solirubrobacterales bacterium]
MAKPSPLVAICMASFDPDPALLERQIASIRAQTHENWVCLVSDDGSAPERFELLRSRTAADPRFRLEAAPQRLGFYLNFERALGMVPAEAEFVALADQDDYWYPEKLAALLAGRGGAELVYSDMRIVDEAGATISETFWRGRRNNHTDLASLLLANTVTGAASLFRRELLELALPFPPPVGDPFHDQWLAAVALASGEIAYVDRPLYDYVQHGAAARGHEAAVRAYAPGQHISWRDPRGTLRRLAARGERSYEDNVQRIGLSARTLEQRIGTAMTAEKARAVRRLARLGQPPEPAAWLALRSLRRFGGHNETMGTELSLAAAIWWRRLHAVSASLGRRAGGRQ